jgi:hypothetical protein
MRGAERGGAAWHLRVSFAVRKASLSFVGPCPGPEETLRFEVAQASTTRCGRRCACGGERRAGKGKPYVGAPRTSDPETARVVVTGPFIKNFPCNHSVNINIIIFFFRRNKRQRNFSLFYFAS